MAALQRGYWNTPVGRIKSGILPQLGIRNYGDERIEGRGNEWGEWEPIGAGLVVRRNVADAFVDFVSATTNATNLGRSGNNLMSGEDSLFSRLADQNKLKCAYQPELKLRHYMSSDRLKFSYLRKLVYGHGRSYVLLSRVTDQPIPTPDRSKYKLLVANFLHRTKTSSVTSALTMVFWDSGYFDEASTDTT